LRIVYRTAAEASGVIMANDTDFRASRPDPGNRDAALEEALPPRVDDKQMNDASVEEQPDAVLPTDAGGVSAAGIALVAVAIAVVLGVFFYGLNAPTTADRIAAAPPPAQTTPPPTAGAAKTGAPHTDAPHTDQSGAKG
jgi:hypothetical protein